MNELWTTYWAQVRRNEMVDLPKTYAIHSDYLKELSQDEFVSAFEEVWHLFAALYEDIGKAPAEYGMPLHEKEKYREYSQQWRDCGQCIYRPFALLFHLFTHGVLENGVLTVKPVNPPAAVKNIQKLFKKLEDFGFCFMGLKNYKRSGQDLELSFPDNGNVMIVLKHMIDQCDIHGLYTCSHRLFIDGAGQPPRPFSVDDVADAFHTETEKQFVYRFHQTLTEMGYEWSAAGGWEGPGIAYGEPKKVYLYRTSSWTGRLLVYLRIRDVGKCLEYLKSCPDSVQRIFTEKNDPGCGKRLNNTCKAGVEYEMGGTHYWRCGCCAPAFCLDDPKIEDIPHYVRLTELGSKKRF